MIPGPLGPELGLKAFESLGGDIFCGIEPPLADPGPGTAPEPGGGTKFEVEPEDSDTGEPGKAPGPVFEFGDPDFKSGDGPEFEELLLESGKPEPGEELDPVDPELLPELGLVLEDPEVEPGAEPDDKGFFPELGIMELGEPGRQSDPGPGKANPVVVDPKPELDPDPEPKPDEPESDAPLPDALDFGAESALGEPTLLGSPPSWADAPWSDCFELPPLGLAPLGTPLGAFGAFGGFDVSAPSGFPVG